MFIQSGDMLSSLCNYQSGTNIADLFTGVPGLNTVWNGYSGCNSYSGISTGCGCNYNSKTIWGMICGTGLGFLGAIGIHWGMSELQSRQAQKVATAKQEIGSEESLNNAMKTLGLNDKTRSEVLEMTKEQIDNIQIVADYNDAALTKAKGAVNDCENKLRSAETGVTKAQKDIDGAKATVKDYLAELAKIEDKNSDNYKNLSKKIDELKAKYDTSGEYTKALEKAKEHRDNVKEDLKKAEAELEDIKEKRKKFNDAKRTVKEAIEKEANKKELEYKKNHKKNIGL